VTIAAGSARYIVHVMNEHMAVDGPAGERLATYPDVITTLSPDGHPLSSNELVVGREVAVLRVPKGRLPMSPDVLDASLYPVAEAALGIDLVSHALA
jgi:DUF917 family protein